MVSPGKVGVKWEYGRANKTNKASGLAVLIVIEFIKNIYEQSTKIYAFAG
jgi:hypothetical protein